ncbi:SDR family NAD(P)-dependent oxidoreductase [Streptomyces sp. KS_5]|uniref:SDR family NAD(P)-dependent oxidoreductase n=1 Tax=Streptomyces sp. KS_5 TaxID=1881018 RepID=UPI00089BABC8|nr:SDR family NAD(P)-dependent oxidoreductase [Streptomyces sp. KS_5]SEE36154.1 NAD(P)-dependent dehydrogenase, short-chain alcohol dehydrogenase family [Streptomyces sp. KS_5]
MKLITTPFTAQTTAAEVLADVDLTGQRIIVTGGASGIGTETVRALAGAGAHVTIATRNPDIADPLVKEFTNTDTAQVDLSDLNSVRAFCGTWRGPVDSIIANAGVMALPTREINAQGWEMQLATNYLGHFALILGLHQALRKAQKPRVVVVSSGAQRLAAFDFADPQFEQRPYDPMTAYAQSKTADVLLAVGISRRWEKFGIAANSCEPGWIHTNLSRHLDQATMQALGAMDSEGNLVSPDYFKTPQQGAATTVLLAASPLVDGITGRHFEDAREAPVVDGGPDITMSGVARWSLDTVAADQLWDYALPFVEKLESN